MSFSTLDHALYLAGKGLRVFPLQAGGKKPIFEKFQLTATSDPARIREWWAEPDCKGCNVGVLTTGMVVGDLDMKSGKDGAASYNAIEGATYDTLVVSTPSGGWHLYFDGPDSGLRVGALPGVDIRSHNGYVVGPGSWTAAGDAQSEGYYQVVTDKPLAWVPLGLANLLRPPRSAAARDDGFAALDTPAAVANAAAWLAVAPPAIEGQGGDDHTFKTAAKLVRDFALTQEAAYNLLLQWNERCSPAWTPAELWLKITNASEYAAGDLGSAQPAIHFNGVSVEAPPAYTPPAPTPASERGVFMGNAPDPSALTARPWKVRGLAMSRDVTVLAGVGAAGKSIMQIVMAAHFALGLDFGPWKLAAPNVPLRSVLYNAEDDTQEQGRRLFGVCSLYKLDYLKVRENIAFMDDSVGELNIAHLEHGNPKQNQTGVDFIAQTLVDLNADLAFFDPMLNLHTCNENDGPQMRFVLTLLRNIGRVTDTSMILAHHSGKGSGARDKGDADAIRGSGAIVNSARLALLLSPITPEEVAEYGLQHSVHRFIRVDDAKTNYTERTGRALGYFEWHGVNTHFGDTIGVPFPTDVTSKENGERVRLGTILIETMISQNTATLGRNAAAKILQDKADMLRLQSTSTVTRRVDKLVRYPVETPAGTLRRVGDVITLT